MEKFAVRNIRLCTKDCLCLYVCQTGASDTENSVIDVNKCIGCGSCVDACPSGAISLMPKKLPVQQQKNEKVVAYAKSLSLNKSKEESIADALLLKAESDEEYKLFTALKKSFRLVNEDILREAGFMLPQSGNSGKFLYDLVENPPKDFPVESAKALLEKIEFNETFKKGATKKYKCLLCGAEFESDEENPVCPMCGASGKSLMEIK